MLLLAITIASVFVKNKKEYDAIVSDLYTDKRKATPPAITVSTPQDDSQHYIYEEEELDEYEQYLLQTGYTVETQRDIKREVAAWEDITVEKSRGKHIEHVAQKLVEMQKINQAMIENSKQKLNHNTGKEIADMMQERAKLDAAINLRKNQAIGVNSVQNHNKIKKLVEKGKIKPNRKTEIGKALIKARKNKLHAEKDMKHANHVEQISEIKEKNKEIKYFR